MNKNIRKYLVKSDLPSFKNFEVDRLLLNRIKTPDGTILTSRHVHDYRTHRDNNGYTYMVDGGTDYLRRNIVVQAPYEELSVYVDEDHEINREFLEWGTYGPNGDQPLQYKKLKDLDTDHIEAILETQKQLPEWKRDIFKEELEYRNGR